MKLSVAKLMRWVVIVIVLLSAGTPMATTAKRESGATDVLTVEPESSVQHILIKVRPEVDTPTGRLMYAALTPLARALTAQGVTTAQTLFRAVTKTPSAIGLERIYLLVLAADADVNKAVAALGTDPNIEWAEPDYIAHAVAIPDDSLYAEQWGLTKIDAPAAWDIVTGTQTVIIAVIDSGIDLTHPDLQANLWANPGEIAGNGIDDDNNGYVDDVRGWNFVNGTNNVYDGNGHGTQVAGVAAAVTNNVLGIAGVCWNCKIMPVRVMADSGISNYSDIALGVRYAADKGAKVINLSLGGYSYSNALRDAIDYAVNEKGAVVVGGAGNDNVSTPFYPAAYDNVLAVAGTTDMDTKAAFSDYGTWVDISAPAVEITTTYLGSDWGATNGTSLAAPFVAGVAALIRSQRPGWSAALVRNQLLQTADNIDALNPTYAGQLGIGRVNAAQATQDPQPILVLAGISVDGDPTGRPVPGEAATSAVTLRNEWWDATGVTGTLTTADPYVTLGQATTSYGDLASGATGTSNPVYSFTVAAGAGYNHPMPFILAISANDGAYTVTLPFTITTRSGDEPFCGTVAEDLLWTNDKRYIIECNVGIAPGYTLTIQAGTEVRFAGDYSLNVGGTLIADGTAAQPILFTGHTGGTWQRIFFDDPSTDAQATSEGVYQSGNLLRHVRIEGAAQGIGCINATPYLDHLKLNSGGVDCALGLTSPWVRDSDLTGNVAFSGDVQGSFYDTPDEALGVAISGDYAYVADGGSGLRVIDVSDPAQPSEVGFYDTPYYASGVTISGTYAYLADGESGLRVIDVSNPTQPEEVGFYDTPAQALDITVFGGYAYVADYPAGLRIIDVSNPTQPVEIGFYNTPDEARSVAISGYYAYVADGGAGLRVIDVSDPTQPTEVGFCNTSIYAKGVAISGMYAYIADAGAGLRVIDISDPTSPAEVGSYDILWGAQNVTISNSYAYMIGESGLRVIDVIDPAQPVEVNFYDTPGAAWDVAFSGGYAYVADGYSGLRIYDTSHTWRVIIAHTAIHSGYLNVTEKTQVLTSTIGGNISAGNGSVIRYTIADGGITINGTGIIADNTANGAISLNSGTVKNNVTSGGISVGAGTVANNIVTGSGISVGSGGVARDNSIENAPGWGIQASGVVTVEYNRVVGCANGIQTSDGIVKGNLIANISAVGLEIGSATIEHNTFTGIGGNAIKITSGNPGLIAGNNFEFNTGTYDVEDLVPQTGLMTVDARNNWWGTTSGTAIRQRIWDFNDDYTIGTVLYSPVLTQPSTIAPAYVRAITLTPESPVGIQTVAFDVLFSREMDIERKPLMAFYTTQKNTWQTYTTSNSGLANDYVSAIAADAVGNTWFSTWGGGVSVLRVDSTWQTYNGSNSALTSDYVHTLAVDTVGNTWIGPDTAFFGGVSVLRADGTWQTYTTDNSGLASNSVYAIAAGATGDMWFGLDSNSGVSVLRADGTWQTYTQTNYVRAIVVDTFNHIWFGTWGNGLAHFDGFNWTIYTTANSGLPNNYIHALSVDVDDAIWVGMSNTEQGGAARFDGQNWTYYNPSDSGPADNWVKAIAVDNLGMKWFGTRYGVARFDGSNWVRYNQSNSDLPFDEVKAIAVDMVGNKWFGTDGAAGVLHGGASVLYGGTDHAIADNPQWLDATHYRATYDFSTLIPRGVYAITISGARTPETTGSGTTILPIPGGGMEIAPNSAYTFTVDYAGYINDTTAPPAPTVIACATATPDTLSATWAGYDPESAINQYQYAIGFARDGIEVVSWTFTPLTETTRVSLTLVIGQTYYISVKARNEGGIWSEAGSVGVVAGSDTCVGAQPASPEVDFAGMPRSGDAPLDVHFTGIVTGEVTSYAWSFGDGGITTTANPMHTYTNAGSFSVSLVVTGPGGTAQTVKPEYITVNPPPGAPTATFSANVVSGTVPLAVTFTAIPSGTIEGWYWSFGDSTVAITGPVVQHTYQIPGVFDVSLTVSNTYGSYTANKPGYITVSSSGGGHRVYLPLVLRN